MQYIIYLYNFYMTYLCTYEKIDSAWFTHKLKICGFALQKLHCNYTTMADYFKTSLT